MPLVAHTSLPTFEHLKDQGDLVLSLNQALLQDHDKLHIGLLNLMPDGAFKATERQFMRLVGSSHQDIQSYIYPFTIPDPKRHPEIQTYIDDYYLSFEDIQEAGLDALIITGTNPANPRLEQEPFWEPLLQIVDWATRDVTSVLCSCLAVHAIAKHLHDIDRQPLKEKRWGVYSHRIIQPDHPLMRDIMTPFDVPHSRNNDVSQAQLEAAGFEILSASEVSGVHMAVSSDRFRIIYLQGHPEYDDISLLKEYKREVARYISGDREGYPQYPENYFGPHVQEILEAHQLSVVHALEGRSTPPEFPESSIAPLVSNTWRQAGRSIFDNWLGLIQELTGGDRHHPFTPNVDPEDPLGSLSDHP